MGLFFFVMVVVPGGLLIYQSSGIGDQHQANQHQANQQQADQQARLSPPFDDQLQAHVKNGKIVFDHSVVNTAAGGGPPIRDIWTINPNGSNRAQLTTTSKRSEEAPAWRPDGRQIAFVLREVTENKLYVMNPDGSNKIELPLPKGAHPYEPTWSPDGERITFGDYIKGGLYMTHTDGSGTFRKLSPLGVPGGATPVWSPEGSQIAFAGGETQFGRQWSDIYVMNVSPAGDTSELRRITADPMEESEPSWSPDGTEIAFYSNRTGRQGIYKVDVNSLKETRLTHSPLYDPKGFSIYYHEPTWSPDGKQIAYVKSVLGGGIPTTGLYKMYSDGSNPTRVYEVEGEIVEHPDWGPRP